MGVVDLLRRELYTLDPLPIESFMSFLPQTHS